MSTNYNRYLDLHLCTSTFAPDYKQGKLQAWDGQRKFFSAGSGTEKIEYFYEFRKDMDDQKQYRTAKSEGYDPDAWWGKGNSRNFCDVEITTANVSMLRCKGPDTNREISDELKRMRYIGCMASIEQLQKPLVKYPNLEGLVHWIADETTTNKLRINCHGSGTATAGFTMGRTADLSAEQLIDSLVLHGLKRGEKGKQNTFGLAHAARWKLDSEVTRCENCRVVFEKTMMGFISNKHHCRRCGGIFCNTCTLKRIDLRVALTGPNKGTANNVKNARVCERCFDEAFDVEHKFGGELVVQEVFGRSAVDSELKYGLQTIALGLCMGARANHEFSTQINANPGEGAAGTLQAGSLACRIRDQLTLRGIRGVKITASNQIVANNARTGNTPGKGLVNKFGVEYPSNLGIQKKDLTQSGLFNFPPVIYGTDSSLMNAYNSWPDPKPARGIVVKGRKIYFGYADPPQHPRPASVNMRDPGQLADPNLNRLYRLLEIFFQNWKFTSWHSVRLDYASSGGGQPDQVCRVLTPPPRVNNIQLVGSSIQVTGLPEDTFKISKSYGVS